MKTIPALKDASPLEKARAFRLLSNLRGSNEELIKDFWLTKYKEALLSDLRDTRNRDCKTMQKQYQVDLVENYIIKEMDRDTNLSDIKASVLVKWAETLAAFLVGNNLKTNQIRKFLDGVRKIEVNIKKSRRKNSSLQKLYFLKCI